ncbi:PKD domain-containing protein [bacterium]|nr:PKD domain-containing protein [bacterium]
MGLVRFLLHTCSRTCTLFSCIPAVLIAGLLAGCGGSAGSIAELNNLADPTGIAAQPDADDLQAILQSELERLGVDTAKATTAAPSTGNEVFNLRAVLIDADGPGGEDPTGVTLTWTERLIGDYDQNGEVSVADLTPLGVYYLETVDYDAANLHDGVAHWPTGDPTEDGVADTTQPPTADSPAANWRKARVDGNSDGVINVSDITPIAQHWQERLNGYHVYRKAPGEEVFTILPDPDDAEVPLLVQRSDFFPEDAVSPDPNRPLCFELEDPITGVGPFEYYLAPYDANSESEGPASTPVSTENQPVVLELEASLVAAPLTGVAPLTVYFNAGGSLIPEGAVPNYKWDWYNGGVYDLDTGTDYAVSHTFTEGGSYVIWVRVQDNTGGLDHASVTIEVNAPPTVELTADIQDGDLPLEVNFTATASDSDGTIASYEWDLDGDRIYETSSEAESTAVHVYQQIGSFFPSVRVTDDQGVVAVAELQIAVHGWIRTIVDGSLYAGRYNSMALIDGKPAIAYFDYSTIEQLLYVRALDTLGLVWPEPVAADTRPEGSTDPDFSRGKECSMVEVAGLPAIAYYDDHDFIGQRLMYIRGLDADGVEWTSPYGLTDESHGRIGWNNSLALVNGNPAIACNSQTNLGNGRKLCYFRAQDELGDSWSFASYRTVDQSYNLEDITLATVDVGFVVPTISYVAIEQDAITLVQTANARYVFATDADGNTWGTPHHIVDIDSNRLDGMSMIMVNGLPAVCYAAELVKDDPAYIYYQQASHATGATWFDAVVISLELTTWLTHNSLAFIDGNPAIASSMQTADMLMYERAEDNSGTVWPGELDLIDPTIGAKGDCNLLEINGHPAICYYDNSDGNLMYAIYL